VEFARRAQTERGGRPDALLFDMAELSDIKADELDRAREKV
jgi:hypothetical protein